MQSEFEEFQVWSHGKFGFWTMNSQKGTVHLFCLFLIHVNKATGKEGSASVIVCVWGELDVGRVCLHWTFAFREHLPMSCLPCWLGTCWCGAVPQWLWASSLRTSPRRPHWLPAAHQWWILTKRKIRDCPWEHDRQCFKTLLVCFIC